jgi:hypothetical protein
VVKEIAGIEHSVSLTCVSKSYCLYARAPSFP